MTLNIGGGFSLLRCASSMVSSLNCAMPPCYAPVPSEVGQSLCSPVPAPLLPQFHPLPAVYPNQCRGSCNAAMGTFGAECGAFSRCWRTRDTSGAALDA